MEITGKLIQKLAMQSGVGKTGTNWQKQEFVIETTEQFPKKICANLWGDKVDVLQSFNIGDTVIMSFNLESREYMGKWYTDVRAWKLEVPTANPAAATQYAAPQTEVPQSTPNYQTPVEAGLPEEGPFTEEGGNDDLPF